MKWYMKLPGYEKFRMYTWHDRFWLGIVEKMPNKLRYWAVINAGSYASTHDHSDLTPDQISLFQVLESEAKRGIK